MMERVRERFDVDAEDTLSTLRQRYDEARGRLLRAMPRERARRERRTRWLAFAGGVAVGAVLTYLLDPRMGRTRRARLTDQAAGMGRDAAGSAERLRRRVTSDAEGKMQAARYSTEGYEPPNDATLAHKVESEILGRPDIPKGGIVVNAEAGRIVLRGQVERPEQREELTRLVERIDGVAEVENLVHLPGQAPPNKEEARRLAR